jgi:hypothetical protein
VRPETVPADLELLVPGFDAPWPLMAGQSIRSGGGQGVPKGLESLRSITRPFGRLNQPVRIRMRTCFSGGVGS